MSLPRHTSYSKMIGHFKLKIIIFKGEFHIISAFSIENSKKSWHLYCNLQYSAVSASVVCNGSSPR